MRNRKELWTGVMAAMGLFCLIMDGKTALSGAREGVWLCAYTLIPTLLPFFFLSNYLSAGFMGKKIPILRPLGRLCRIPEGGEYILLTGLIGGYPLGAQAISVACNSGSLAPDDGRRMLAFCNNCGPAFLFGISAALFPNPLIPWLLFGIHVISALMVGLIIPGKPCRVVTPSATKPSVGRSLRQAIFGLATVCCWVILFRIVISMLGRWFLWFFPEEIQVAVMGILELSNGCMGVSNLQSPPMRLILCSGFLAFGGLCVTMQTFSAAPAVDKGLYFPGKVMQAAISVTLACLLCTPEWAVIPGLIAGSLGIFLRKQEIRCRNLRKLVV